MRQETNNEMDLLLRRLSRRQTASPSGTALPNSGEHLDADELSAYAENALPAAAQSRYTEHLAECSSCRELVVRLSASVGFVPAREKATVLEGSGFRKFLASLFSPMVLRYAVPALGLIVVATIGFVVFRPKQPGGFVAQLETPAPQPRATEIQKSEAPALDKFIDSQEKSESPAAAPDKSANRAKQADSSEADAAAPLGVGSGAIKDAARPREEQTIANAPAPVAQPAPTPTVFSEESKRIIEAEARKPEPQGRLAAAKEASVERALDRARVDSGKVGTASGSANTKSETSESVRSQVGASTAKLRRDGTEEKAKDEEAAETRSVAGRRFRKQRGIWIDTAYESSRSTVNLTRSSEQYRALVADEPSIKAIAEQLDGEVIVVWKGRAYRIR